MSWEGALLVILSMLVCAELYSMRKMIEQLYDEISRLNETYRKKIIEKLDRELHDERRDSFTEAGTCNEDQQDNGRT